MEAFLDCDFSNERQVGFGYPDQKNRDEILSSYNVSVIIKTP